MSRKAEVGDLEELIRTITAVCAYCRGVTSILKPGGTDWGDRQSVALLAAIDGIGKEVESICETLDRAAYKAQKLIDDIKDYNSFSLQ